MSSSVTPPPPVEAPRRSVSPTEASPYPLPHPFRPLIECDCATTGKQKKSSSWATIHVFTALTCLLIVIHQALVVGYFNSVLTTIERRFDISSQLAGAIVSIYDLGYLSTILFVTYFGTRHIPRCLAAGITVIAFGSLLFASPHFFRLSPTEGSSNRASNHSLGRPHVCLLEATDRQVNQEDARSAVCHEDAFLRLAPYLVLFFTAKVLIGAGSTPVFALTTTYIDDNVSKTDSPVYLGVINSMTAVGTALGFLLGSLFTAVHENALGTGYVPPGATPADANWTGAWWAGFVLLGGLLLTTTIPFCLFPKTLRCPPCKVHVSLSHLPSDSKTALLLSTTKSPSPQPITAARSLSDLPGHICRLVMNPVYMLTTAGAGLEIAIVSGFTLFLPKYFETQFATSKSLANLLTGGVLIPGACAGLLLGGWLMKRWSLGPKGALGIVLGCNLLALALYLAAASAGCSNVHMAGTTVHYGNTVDPLQLNLNLTTSCNLACRCSANHLEPVCDLRSRISYYSPCYAGCTSANGGNFTDCSCLHSNSSVHLVESPVLVSGLCPQPCTTLLLFLVLIFLLTIAITTTHMPVMMVILRVVPEENKSLALGMHYVLLRLIGYLPAPIIFGNAIDSTCLVWKETACGQRGGSCWLYDIELFRFRYVQVSTILKLGAGLFFTLSWLLVTYRPKKKKIHSPPGSIVEFNSFEMVDSFSADSQLKSSTKSP